MTPKIIRLRSRNVLTLKEAEHQCYGSVNAIKKQILRGVVPADKVGTTWLVHRRDLEKMVKRREEWESKMKKES